jgi:hypothetical protein
VYWSSTTPKIDAKCKPNFRHFRLDHIIFLMCQQMLVFVWVLFWLSFVINLFRSLERNNFFDFTEYVWEWVGNGYNLNPSIKYSNETYDNTPLRSLFIFHLHILFMNRNHCGNCVYIVCTLRAWDMFWNIKTVSVFVILTSSRNIRNYSNTHDHPHILFSTFLLFKM